MVDICIESNEFGCSDIMAAIYDSGMTHEHYHGGISLAQKSEKTQQTSSIIPETGTAVMMLCAAGLAFYTATWYGKKKEDIDF
jgi:hypothetical protein